jgi:hypothetical protein
MNIRKVSTASENGFRYTGSPRHHGDAVLPQLKSHQNDSTIVQHGQQYS